MPSPVSIYGRSSSITNAFINSIIPVVAPKYQEVENALSILGMRSDEVRCAYCGGQYTEWDHLRPLVVNQKPTGYISEIANLVPACGKCNQSKGNKYWRAWMLGDAPLSPKSREVPALEEKFERLADYESWRDIRPLDFESIVGKEHWEQHWSNWQYVLDSMKSSQNLAAKLRIAISQSRSL